MSLRIAGMVTDSLVDGPGVRFALFVQGCPLHCPGCHNPETADPRGGVEMPVSEVLHRIRAARGIDGVTFSGGEPFYQAAPLARLGPEIARLGYNLVIYTGYTLEKLLSKSRRDQGIADLLAAGWLLIDGPYLQGQRDISLPFRGSRNQRILDLPRSLELNRAEVWERGEP